jgi:hypothetical protein
MAAPCLDCGTPTGRKPARCQACASVRNRERNQRRVRWWSSALTNRGATASIGAGATDSAPGSTGASNRSD